MCIVVQNMYSSILRGVRWYLFSVCLYVICIMRTNQWPFHHLYDRRSSIRLNERIWVIVNVKLLLNYCGVDCIDAHACARARAHCNLWCHRLTTGISHVSTSPRWSPQSIYHFDYSIHKTKCSISVSQAIRYYLEKIENLT